ncbi:hypothetical protein MVES_002674 [Malassezia vespertilionis]|uniref:Carbohydrate kinase PfkB domain-containing protein n=1 Tax=Malassezia vespertilionis TaxID=2020962 RepID=A0A2N1JAM1_9BASI|nr:hypothetical protein MVES_002674 [Malassezia vespertilionis]
MPPAALPHIVKLGETISSSGFVSRPGGKGANVAAALSLAGAQVTMLGAVGTDAEWPLMYLEERGVDTRHVYRSKTDPTGRAFIQIAADGENSIVLLQGANYVRSDAIDDPAAWMGKCTHLMLQNEIPLEVTVAYAAAAQARKEQGEARLVTAFNPSPMLSAAEIKTFPWGGIDVLIVNEGEAADMLRAMTGKDESTSAPAEALAALPALAQVTWIVVTRGSHGSAASVQLKKERIYLEVPAHRAANVVNTTGAGDTFTGYLVAGLMDAYTNNAQWTRELIDTVLHRASVASSMAVEKDGAMESMPSRAAVDAVVQ